MEWRETVGVGREPMIHTPGPGEGVTGCMHKRDSLRRSHRGPTCLLERGMQIEKASRTVPPPTFFSFGLTDLEIAASDKMRGRVALVFVFLALNSKLIMLDTKSRGFKWIRSNVKINRPPMIIPKSTDFQLFLTLDNLLLNEFEEDLLLIMLH